MSNDLLCVVVFGGNTGGIVWRGCVLTPLLPYHTVQSGEYVTPNSTTLVYVSEERARGTPRLPRISLLGPPPHSFSLSSLKI